MTSLMSRLRRAGLAALLAAASVQAAGAEVSTDTPSATVMSLQQGLVELSQREPDASIDERYRALQPLIVATHDLSYIAEFALRRQWPTLSEADRERFVAAFERLSVMTYAARFVSVGPETFRAVDEIERTEGRARATTAIARQGASDVSLEYVLQPGDSGWRIINIVADGVSDLALKRSEYQRLLAEGTLDGLIAELEQQTERLRTSR